MKGKIVKISGPVVHASSMRGSRMYDVVYVGEEELLGEIIQLKNDIAIIQVYEDTTGLKINDKVQTTDTPLAVELGPGLISNIFDGIARPLETIAEKSGDFIARGINIDSLNKKTKHEYHPIAKLNSKVNPGTILGYVQETSLIKHKIMVPPEMSGTLKKINKGKKKVTEVIAEIKTEDGLKKVTMSTKWPVRKPRPTKEKVEPDTPLITGKRIFDTLFPIAKGGIACIPGPFGAGKTVTQHDLAKWSDADIIVYIGCGERGNEMTDVLHEFPALKDPRTGKPLMERTILIANTSNMPVAAREASVYTGITIAEYYRDMGYNVALMADSTSRWAEAMREISSRLEEMPGEEGYPAYLGSKLASFYERAGKVINENGTEGTLTVIGAVSPQGGDFSEPVTQNTLRIARVFWALDSALAYKRHFPSVNWLLSYSLYEENLRDYYTNNVSKDFYQLKNDVLEMLQKESELQEIVQLVGPDAIPEKDKLILYIAKIIREDFMQQSSFHDIDVFSDLDKQYSILNLMYTHYINCQEVLEKTEVKEIIKLKINEEIARLRYEKLDKKKITTLHQKSKDQLEALIKNSK